MISTREVSFAYPLRGRFVPKWETAGATKFSLIIYWQGRAFSIRAQLPCTTMSHEGRSFSWPQSSGEHLQDPDVITGPLFRSTRRASAAGGHKMHNNVGKPPCDEPVSHFAVT